MVKIEDYIASYPDFPKEGILFRDMGPLPCFTGGDVISG